MISGKVRRIAACAAFSLAPLLVGQVSAKDTAPKEVRKYRKLYRKADRLAERDRWDKVLVVAEKMSPLAPEGTLHLGWMARAHAALGQPEAALEALERMVDLGWTDTNGLPRDDQYALLVDEPGFEELSQKAAETARRFDERNRTRHGVVDPASAEAFASVEDLVAAYGRRSAELQQRGMLLAGTRWWDAQTALIDGRLAALERYLVDHPDAGDRETASLEILRTSLEYREYLESYDGDAPLIIESANRFLEAWPASAHVPEVELARAVAHWRAFGDEDEQTSRSERAEKASTLLLELESRHPDAPEAARSRVWRLAIDLERNEGAVTSEIETLFRTVDAAIADDDELAQYAWDNATRAMFQIKGAEIFDAVDLDGHRWTWDGMRGKVVLLDFWATWCGPCVGELPHLREAYEKFHDRGFEIVGISLDVIDRNKFEETCGEKGIVWPQIYDGKGWEAEVARRFHISGIPTPVLLDREGRVAGVQGDVRGEDLLVRVEELVGNSAEDPSN